MGKKVYFLDSVKQSDGSYDNTYGVDDVNAIVSNLVGAGVAPFPSGDTYDVSELNSLTSALVAEGTSLDGLKVSFADNKIHIAQGIGYFENGATIVVDADGEELDYNVAETLYVYAEYNQALNTCGFYTSESKPTSSTGIYVLILATIAADGVVTDKRVIAQSKIATLGRNVVFDVPFPGEPNAIENGLPVRTYAKGEVLWEGNLDLTRFNYVLSKGHYMYRNVNSYEATHKISSLESGPIMVFNNELNYNYQTPLYLKKEGAKVILYAEGYATVSIYTDYENYIRFI